MTFGLTQSTLPTKYLKNRGCGIIGIANVIYYYTRKDTKDIINDTLKIIKPTPIGIFSALHLETALKKVGEKYDIPLITDVINPKTFEDLKWFINHTISNGGLVLMLNWNHKNPDFKNHWVTILNMEKEKIITSNWGERRIYNLDQEILCGNHLRIITIFKKES